MANEEISNNPPAKTFRHMVKPLLIFTLKLLTSGLLLYFVSLRIDFADLVDAILSVNAVYLVISIVVLLAQIAATNIRWTTISHFFGLHILFFPALRISYIGALANQGFPSFLAGDAIRVLALKKIGNGLAESIRVTILDRIASMVVMVMMLDFACFYLLPQMDSGPLKVNLYLLALTGSAASIAVFHLDRLPQVLRRLKIISGIADLSWYARALVGSRNTAIVIFAQALVGNALLAVHIYVLAIGLKIDLTLFQCLLVMPPIILISSLPLSIAGWGIREGAMIAALSIFQISTEAAFALSVMVGITALIHSLLGVPALYFRNTARAQWL
jgi:glycosyltransferase 2 family protein